MSSDLNKENVIAMKNEKRSLVVVCGCILLLLVVVGFAAAQASPPMEAWDNHH